MKKKILIGFIALLALYITWEQVKGNIFTWYAVNMMARETAHPATTTPDQITLTWSDNPAVSMTVNWRTAPSVAASWAQVRPALEPATTPTEVAADRAELTDPALKNDPNNARYTAELKDLVPNTEYAYRVGDKGADTWTEWQTFKTAAGPGQPLSFIYLGDAQVGLDYYGEILHRANEKYPNALFNIVAGDLVNSGACRNEWDDFFHASTGVFNRKALVPCLGNHDYQKQDVPEMYLSVFGLPQDGPSDFPPEHAYAYNIGDVLLVVLDSNLPAEKDQAEWLDATLGASTKKWKIALYHHPAYSSKENRENPELFDLWTPLFDRHHLDLALQGHDHAYLRTFPMKEGKRVASAAEGTYYVVTVSGTKYYEQEQHDYAEVAFPNTSTYQVIEVNDNILSYKAFDFDHKLRDEFTIQK